MTRFKLFTIVLPSFLFWGCVSTDLSPNGKQVRVVRGDVAKNCSEIGSKSAMSGAGAQAAKNMLRNWAATQGANQVTFDTIETAGANTSMTATAFRCP